MHPKDKSRNTRNQKQMITADSSGGLNSKLYCSIPRPIFTIIILLFVTLSFIFNSLILVPDEIKTQCIAYEQHITRDVKDNLYRFDMNVTFTAKHLSKPSQMDGTIYDACISKEQDTCEQCGNRFVANPFTCYYALDPQNDSSIYAVFTSSQYRDQLSLVEKFSFGLTFLTYFSVLIPIVLIGVLLVAWAHDWNMKVAMLRIFRELIYQSYSYTPFDENCYQFDETESPSQVSFLSTDVDTYRKKACMILLRNTIQKVVDNENETEATVTEKVLWHYSPSYLEMLRSLYSIPGLLIILPVITIIILILTIFELSVMIAVGAAFFGLSFALILIVLPILAVIVFIFQLGAVLHSHFFITNYRSIVLIELPLRLGFLIKYKDHKSVAKVTSRKLQMQHESIPRTAGSVVIYTEMATVFSEEASYREIMLFEYCPERKQVAVILKGLLPEQNANPELTSEQSGLLEA
jgi:hypothetical protein